MESETLEQMQARHRKEQRDLVARTTQKKKNATKKTRKGVNDECADMERRLREKQEEEFAALTGTGGAAEEEEPEPGSEDEREEAQQGQRRDAAAEDVAEKLEKTTISEPAPQDQAQTQGGGGGGKKRNRQKERMARRAAEQEAALTKAEEEASSMTDHRGIEKTYMLNEFKAHSLSEQEIAPDGHCLFSAVADQLRHKGIPLAPGSEQEKAAPPYKVVRRRAAEWMETHPDDFAPFLEEGLEGYVGKIRDTAEWGGQLELVALSGVYGVEIRVVQDGRTEKIGEGEEVVWLAYYRHGYGLGEHYNSLRKTAA